MTVPIKVTVQRTEKIDIDFKPIKHASKWQMYIIDRGTSHEVLVPMDEFLKICRAFAADAENYK